MLNVWLVTIGEQLPLNDKVRKLRTAYLADELISRNHQVLWFTSAFDHFKKKWIVNSDQEQVLHERFKIKFMKGYGYKKNISISRFIDHRRLAKKFSYYAKQYTLPDIIIVSMPAYDLANAAVKFAKQFNIPVLIDIRDQWPDIFIDKSPLPRFISRALLTSEFKILKQALKNATGILAVSDSFLQWGINYANRNKLASDAVFYLGYRKNSEMTSDINFAEKYLFLRNKFVVTFIGTFEEYHDPRIMVSAAEYFKEYEDIHFVLAGDGHYRQEIVSRIANLKNITLAGWLDQQEIDTLLEYSNVGVCTTNRKADLFPNKAFSYFAFGLPVISAFQGSLQEVLSKYSVGFNYEPNNVTQFVEHIKTLKNSTDLYKKMNANALSLYKQKLDSDLIYQEYATHVESVTNNYKKT